MSDPVDSYEYIEAVAKAMKMPYGGINRLEITAGYAAPVIVRFEYILEGTQDLLNALPTRDSAQVQVEE